MIRVEPRFLAVLLAAWLATPLAALAAAPQTVSPGELDRAVETAGACPTFSWTARSDAPGFELAVFALGERDEPELVLRRVVAGAATSWTPARGDCLAPGRDYVWNVRVLTGDATDPAWSAPRRFRVPGLPSDEEVAAALDVLTRWRGHGANAPGVPPGATPLPRPLPGGRGSAPAGGAPAAAISGTFTGSNGVGVSGIATSTSGSVTGVRGETASSFGAGVVGISTATTNGPVGVYGEILATNGFAVWGRAPETTGYAYGVRGDAGGADGTGVYGIASDTTGPYSYGVKGYSNGPGAVGVAGQAVGLNSVGVVGSTSSTVGGVGVASGAPGTNALGVDGYVSSSTGQTTGVRAWVNSTQGRGVYAHMAATSGAPQGVVATVAAPSGVAVYGDSSATTGATYGVRGETSSTQGRGVYGSSDTTQGYAGYFAGKVQVTGTLSKGGGSFKIDHPLDPEHRYLYHSFVESPDMMNVYNGNVTLDERGSAWVELPDWFEALNRDFRYQLTPIGQPSAVWIGHKIADHRFEIRGGPAVEVSWQVTGIRHDKFAEAHRIPVEEVKPDDEQGTYLHPREWGLNVERGLEWKTDEPLRRALEERRDVGLETGDAPGWYRIQSAAPLPEAPRAPR